MSILRAPALNTSTYDRLFFVRKLTADMRLAMSATAYSDFLFELDEVLCVSRTEYYVFMMSRTIPTQRTSSIVQSRSLGYGRGFNLL